MLSRARKEAEQVDAVVIGAGVVGLACARTLAQDGREVLILEQDSDIGTGTSSRNSEVIHAGIYYPQGSLKAQLCVRGKHQLYSFCERHGVAHQRCGKLIVATSTVQEERLHQIREQAAANGVPDLQWLTAAEVHVLEPDLRCSAALLSPSTGIVDSHELMLALLGEAESAGAVIAHNAPLLTGRVSGNGIELSVGGEAPLELRAATVVNAAGLHAIDVARSLEGMPASLVPHPWFAKGNYFSLSSRSPFTRLIYPVPEPGGLGVHLTLDLAGQARFGPDVEWVDGIDYAVNAERGQTFYAAIRRYWPGLPDCSLQPAYSGIRPKIAGPEEADADFVIQDSSEHGIAGLVNLFGIESPGLTSCLAIAEEVQARV